MLFELIGARYERRSMLITANQPFADWDKVFPDHAMMIAAIDRLVHHAIIFEMNVESYRRRGALDRKSQTAPAASKKTKGQPHAYPRCQRQSEHDNQEFSDDKQSSCQRQSTAAIMLTKRGCRSLS